MVKSVFSIGTGRCGTRFLALLFQHCSGVRSVHELSATCEIMFFYAKWYGLAVDPSGFIETKRRDINSSPDSSLYFESSPYLSMAIENLFRAFSSKFIFLIRNPEDVVNSWLERGLYARPLHRSDPTLPPSFQPDLPFPLSYGRGEPLGEEYVLWHSLTRVGKCAWYWNKLNSRINDQLTFIPSEQWKLSRLEEFDFSYYEDICFYLNLEPALNQHSFEKIVKSRPNKSKLISPNISMWTSRERGEFENQIQPSACLFGYR